MSVHAVAREHAHLAWDNSLPPVLTVESGAEISFDCLDASNGQITSSSTTANLSALDFSRLDQANGPVFVKNAKPGDVLQVEVLSLQPADWGWTAIIPGFGLLHDEFPQPALRVWSINHAKRVASTILADGKVVEVVIRPFMGMMGVARGELGAFSTIPPYKTGGNIDTKHLTEGSTLFLPIEVEGALFSLGDGHAAQGDGEVCGTAIETPMRATVRLTVIPASSKPNVSTPHFTSTAAPETLSGAHRLTSSYTTTGVGPDLHQCARDATRAMIAHLAQMHHISRDDAYMLCSVLGDLRIHEIVDMPNYVVGMMMPEKPISR
ncbi:acetamidase/formamidase [Auriculariales sp. MPI-PUGE-AT-0066]|nr:acetamidase/formamidase [Auriculariales sp. MPI-PUGE-AT-0066]